LGGAVEVIRVTAQKHRKVKSAIPYRLVHVLWEDHAGAASDSWRPCDEIAKDVDQPYLVESVGWLVAENKRRIVVVPNIH
jgi:hypothetical protein